jgi:hypothetical protein
VFAFVCLQQNQGTVANGFGTLTSIHHLLQPPAFLFIQSNYVLGIPFHDGPPWLITKPNPKLPVNPDRLAH